MHKFEGHDHGDEEEWEAHIKVEIRTEDNDEAGFALVQITWEGGSATLEANKDGKIDERVAPFSTSTVQLTISRVDLDGFVYRPDLNHESASIVIEGPD